MQTITRDVVVDAPQQQVFSFLVDPHNLAEIWPSIDEVKSVKKARNNSGFKFNWSYKMAGVPFEGKCETIEYTPYERLTIKSTKGLDSTITWSLKPVAREQQTQVTLTFEYQTPASIMKQMEEAALAQENERDVEVMLQNLRNRLELEPAHA